jgi:hypothetical protein
VELANRVIGWRGDKFTLRRRVGDVLGAFLAATAWRSILQLRWTLQHWTSLLHARQPLAIALALDARILGERHLALIDDILTVQVAAWKSQEGEKSASSVAIRRD